MRISSLFLGPGGRGGEFFPARDIREAVKWTPLGSRARCMLPRGGYTVLPPLRSLSSLALLFLCLSLSLYLQPPRRVSLPRVSFSPRARGRFTLSLRARMLLATLGSAPRVTSTVLRARALALFSRVFRGPAPVC